jgi:hypothetical protein
MGALLDCPALCGDMQPQAKNLRAGASGRLKMVKHFILAALFAALPVLAQAQKAPSPVAVRPAAQHGEWTALLGRYVKPGAVARFDYAGLKASKADRAALDAYIARFAKADLSAATPENFATLANLYNAITVRHIAGRYPVKSIRDGYIVGPWKDVKTEIGGKLVSLDAIEHEILRAKYKDPRVHYALNCASIGCPDLQARAFEAATLEADLDAAARGYINSARGVAVTPRGLRVSEIYKWFEADFGGSKAKVIEHLQKYAKPELAKQIKANPVIRSYAYDWSLNDAAPAKKN